MLFLFIYCYLLTKIICQKFYNTNGTNSTKYFYGENNFKINARNLLFWAEYVGKPDHISRECKCIHV